MVSSDIAACMPREPQTQLQRFLMFIFSMPSAVTAVAGLSWYPPNATNINNLTVVVSGSGTNGFIYDGSFTPDERYGVYNYCNMPHVRAQEYVIPDKDVYKLEYVEVIQRHHKRTPYQSNTFPVEDREWPDCEDTREFYYGQPNSGFTAAKIYWNNYQDPLNPLRKSGYQGSCQFPQITKDGLQDSYMHGKDLYEVYGKKLNFLPKDYDKTIIFRVTSNVITSQVAGGLIKGMFDSSEDVPVLKQYDTIDTLQPGYSCAYADAVRTSYQGSNTNWTKHLEASQLLFNKLDVISGVDPSDGGWHSWWDHYFDNLSSRLCHQLPLPCSVASPKNCISSEDANEVFRFAQYEYSYIYRDAPKSLEYARTKYGLYLNELVERIQGHVQGNAEIRYRHNIAHDGSIAPLLGALQVSEMVWPGMGSEVVFELYSSSGESQSGDIMENWAIRVLWGGRVMHSSAMGRLDMMPVDEFLGYLVGLVGDGASYVLEKCEHSRYR